MRSRNLLFLYVQRVRTHPLQELLALIGVAVGVALVFAVQVANTSVTSSVSQLVRGVTGSATLQLTARDEHGFDAAIAARVARLPGVRQIAPVVVMRANVLGPRGARTINLIGGDRRLGQVGGRLVRQFASSHLQIDDAVVLPAPLVHAIGSDGETALLQVGSATQRVPVATVLGREQIGSLVDSPVALAPLGYAQRISGLGDRISRVLVVAQPGRAAAVRAALLRIAGDRLNVVSGDRETRLLEQASAPNNQSTALFATISALVGLLFAFNAMLLTVPERRRFLADLRMEGLGDATVVRLVLFDALVLGLAASGAGLLLGDLLSRSVFHSVPGYLSYAFTIGSQRIVEPRSVALAIAGGVGATVLAALRPLGDLFSRRALDNVYREDDERDEDAALQPHWLLLAGLALLAGATAVLVLAPAATVVGIGLLVAALLLSIPSILTTLLGAIDALSHRLRAPVLVVSIGELRATTTRSIALAATGALAVFGSVAIEGAHSDLQRGLDRDAYELNAGADVWITASGQQNALATVPFGIAARSRLAGARGIRSVAPYRGGFLDVGDRRLWIVAPSRADPAPIPPSQLLRGDRATASRRLRSGGWAALSRAVADERHLRIGDSFELPTPHPVPLRLAAVITNLGWAPGAVILSAEDYRRAWSSDDVTALQAHAAPGVTPEAAARAARGALGTGSGLDVETAARREQRFRASSRQGLDRLTQIATLVLVAAALAMATAMAGVVWLRRPRLATLKLSGFSDTDVWRALLIESTIVLGIGCSIGALFGLYGQLMLTRWLRDSTGFPTNYATAGTLALSAFASVTFVAVAIAALPGYFAARTPPTTSLQED
jgi:putative ABC transport system permease protein